LTPLWRFGDRKAVCDVAHITVEPSSLFSVSGGYERDSQPNSVGGQISEEGIRMKKTAMLIATVATLAAVASAPAEARGHRARVGVGAGVAIAAAAVAATVAADAYGYGPGYYYGPAPVYYGGPVYYGVHHRGW
jgi:hypothetical protein